MKLITLRRTWLSTLALLFCGLAFALSSPLEMMQKTTDEMLSALKAKQASIQKDPTEVYGLAYKIILPHLDTAHMSRAVVGPGVWAKATDEQKKTFEKSFTDLLIRSYASALSSYKDQRVEYFPIRGGYKGQTPVQINSQIIPEHGPPIPVSYRLAAAGSEWKVYDFSVDNVSMVDSFRSQFSSDLNKGGLAYLIQKLQQHNESTK